MHHPNTYDAIQYVSRFTGRKCLAIYDRRDIPIRILSSVALPRHPEADRFLAANKIALV